MAADGFGQRPAMYAKTAAADADRAANHPSCPWLVIPLHLRADIEGFLHTSQRRSRKWTPQTLVPVLYVRRS